MHIAMGVNGRQASEEIGEDRPEGVGCLLVERRTIDPLHCEVAPVQPPLIRARETRVIDAAHEEVFAQKPPMIVGLALLEHFDGDFEPRDEGMFTLSGLTLTVLIRSSTDPDRKGVIFTTDVSFPAPGRATFTNAALLTAGSTEEETVSAGSWSTAVETGTWGRIKASIR